MRIVSGFVVGHTDAEFGDDGGGYEEEPEDGDSEGDDAALT